MKINKKINKAIISFAAIGVAYSLNAAGAARDLEDICWFYAGFDSPTRIAGGCFPGEPKAEGIREGRYGNGCYFHSPTENALPPMAEFLSSSTNFTVTGGGRLETGRILKLSGGSLQTVSRHVAIRNSHPWVARLTGYTCSFFVKGQKDAELTARINLAPLTASDVAKIDNRCKGGDWHKLADEPLLPDVASNHVWKLSGDWQRVFAYAKLDNREQVTGRDVSLAISCDHPIELKDFQFQQSSEFPKNGNFCPTVFTDGGTKTSVPALWTSDPTYVSSFPVKEGSFTAWVKCFEADAAPNHPLPVWGFSHPWTQNWGFNGYAMKVCTGRDCHYQDWDKYTLPLEWRHYAATWKDGEVKLYVDGELRSDRTAKGLEFDDMKTGGVNVFRLGSRADGDGAADALVDDVAIFSGALTDEEIAAIAKSQEPLFAGSRRILAEPVAFTTFFRNQTNAAIRTAIYAPEGGRYVVNAKVGSEVLPPMTLAIDPGKGRLAIPFNPALYRPGRYHWEFSLTDSKGKVALARKGELDIRGRLERDAFRIMSWGGSKRVHSEFYPLCGINAVNCNSRSDVGEAVRNGLFANIRYENYREMHAADYDYAKIAESVPRDLAYAEGLHTWVSTLVNSEVYGAGNVEQPKTSARFNGLAEKEIGMKPEWTFVHNPAMVDYTKLGEKCPSGIVDGTHPTFRSLHWFMDSGMPCYRLNGETASRVHELDPDNCVWTEPIMAPGGMGRYVDSMADWIYEYDANVTLSQLRSMGGLQRGIGKPFLPTISGNYWPEQKGSNPGTPDTKVKTDMGQSFDENRIKSWMALSAVKTSHLHFFAADSWEYGVSNALKYAADPKAEIPQIAEPDAPRRFGEFVRTKLTPAAELLRDIDNVRAPVALILTSESLFAGAFGWNLYWYPRDFTRLLCQTGVPFDVLHEHELTEKILSQYKYVIFPMARVVTQEHDAILKKVGLNGSVIVLDSYATVTYPNAVKLPLKTDPRMDENTLRKPFRDWFTNRIDAIKAELPAWSDADFEGEQESYTFTKECEGVKYVTVVNNRRRIGGSILTEFKTNSWYKPHGAPRHIATTLNVPGGGAVYEFNGRGLLTARENPIEADYAAAEARIFAVYPRPIDKINIKLRGEFAAGSTAWAEISVLDKSGKPAPGRQVIDLVLTAPDGTTRDESGLYAVHGITRVPLRFAKGEETGSFFKKWKLSVRELTSGLTGDASFKLD